MAAGVDLRIVMLGPPGSGKGTQAALLAEKLDLPAISTGEMLREAVLADSELGRKVDAIMASGQLVDDETMAAVVRERLAAEDTRGGFILDGYPWTPAQVATLEEILEADSLSINAALVIEVSEEVLTGRALARQRVDDTAEVIRARYGLYEEKTAPLLDYYAQRDLLLRVEGDQSIEEVAADVLEALAVEA